MSKKHLKFFIIISAIGGMFLILSYFLNILPVKAEAPIPIKEIFFTVEDSEGDAIGLKVMENPKRLPPLLWYNDGENVPNHASPTYLAIDNYYAVRDGRTIYIGATDIDNSTIDSYIYILSYNEGASSETINIFNQLLNNWKFNINITNPTHKLQLQRDLLRIYDISETEKKLDDYYGLTSYYPNLSSGSYGIGETYSTWPSWQYTLSNELGQSLPIDPINRFNTLDGPCANCFNDPGQPDYQCSGTCYNPTTGIFSHPNGSHVYRYLTSDDDLCAGQGYSLFANLEYKPDSGIDIIWLGEEDIIISQDDDAVTYNYDISKGAGECGDNIKDACEECECNSGGLICTEGDFIPEKTCLDLGLGVGIYTSGLQCVNCHWRREVCEKINLGGECNFDTECLSGYCSDIVDSVGVCCDTACEGLCQHCAGGNCQLVASGNDPRDVCPDSNTSPCSTGFCDGAGACELETPGVSCGICKYCSISGQCLNIPLGEDYNLECINDPANCEAGYCDGFGFCTYYPEDFICGDCEKCDIQHSCQTVPEGTNWGFHFNCVAAPHPPPPDYPFVCYPENYWGNCNGSWTDGCETNLLINNDHCSDCDAPCYQREFCDFGVCQCEGIDWGNCDRDRDEKVCSESTWHACENDNDCPTDEICENNVLYYLTTGFDANGCETSLLSNDTNCGVCGNVCDLNTECDSSGNCVCQYGYGDCNGVTLDGCETDFSIDDDNCGICGNACEDNYLCCNYDCVESQFADDFPTENNLWQLGGAQSHVDITLDDQSSYTGDDSIRFQQDANEPYPGICSQAVCEGTTDPLSFWPNSFPYKADCIWEIGPPNVCNFTDYGSCGDCDFNEGDDLMWKWTNRVMWGKTFYDVSDFALQANKEYVFSFYYKGYTTSDVSMTLCYKLGHCSQSYSCAICHAQGDCNAACDINFTDPTDACGLCRFLQYPFQTTPYPTINLGSLPAGDYPSWQKYIYSFVYTSEMANTLSAIGILQNEVGLSVGYIDTGDMGTNFYIDDVRFKGCPQAIPAGESCADYEPGAPCGFHMQCNDLDECVCTDDWEDCDNDETNGCETNILVSWYHCGSCIIQCDDEEDCENGVCEYTGGGGGGNVSP